MVSIARGLGSGVYMVKGQITWDDGRVARSDGPSLLVKQCPGSEVQGLRSRVWGPGSGV